MSSPEGRPLLTHRRLGTELTISAGSKHTGNPPQMANFHNARGSGTERAAAHQPELFTFASPDFATNSHPEELERDDLRGTWV
ncbi:hypothetical protein [uncultured Corynebacterium sp.]|uniref:hypothetical protein n=1 Tax=uncultured Corynebacterium sp. TaxID=159447 RepID=UPI00259925FE|nr:hypothetical protein [uncultured Corynebacterium sp.]